MADRRSKRTRPNSPTPTPTATTVADADAADDSVRHRVAPPPPPDMLARLPTAVASLAFSFLRVCDHAALWRTNREWARVARLPTSAPHAATLRLVVDEVVRERAFRAVADMRVRRLVLLPREYAHDVVRERAFRAVADMRVRRLVLLPREYDDENDADYEEDDGQRRPWLDARVFARVCSLASLHTLECGVSGRADIGELSALAPTLVELTLELDACATDLAPLGALVRLRRLALRFSYDPPGHPWRVGKALQPLSHLESFAISCDCDGYDFSMPAILSLEHDIPLLPASLTALDVFGSHTQSGSIRDDDDVAGWNALLRLPLRALAIGLVLSDARFGQLLASCPRLERLVCLRIDLDGATSAVAMAVAATATTISSSSSSPLSSSLSLPLSLASDDRSAREAAIQARETTMSRHGLQHLAVEWSSPAEGAAQCLARLPRLTNLAWSVADLDVGAIFGRASAHRLATLALELYVHSALPFDLAPLADEWALPALTDLTLRAGTIVRCDSFVPLDAFSKLRRLTLDQFYAKPDAPLPRLPALEHLVIFVSPRSGLAHPDPVALLRLYPALLSLACESMVTTVSTTVMTRERASDDATVVFGNRQLLRR